MDNYMSVQQQHIIANEHGERHTAIPNNQGMIDSYSDSASEGLLQNPSHPEPDDVIELDADFDLEGYQVIRREFFSHTKEPAITFANYKVYVNAACLKRFKSVDYVQPMVNVRKKTFLLRASREADHDVVPWCVPGASQRKPRHISCKMLFANLYSVMDWNPDWRYKILGKVVHARNGYFITFDLTATEVYQCGIKASEKSMASRAPVFIHAGQEQFGLPYEEHQKSMQVNIVSGYAVYAIKDNRIAPVQSPSEESSEDFFGLAVNTEMTGSMSDE